MIIDDIQHARDKGDITRAALLRSVLKHYLAEHHWRRLTRQAALRRARQTPNGLA
jgi:hypothetical protein